MGIFSKKRATPAGEPPERITVTAGDLARADELLARFEHAQMNGPQAAIDAAILAIARAGDVDGSPAWAEYEKEYFRRCIRNMSATGDSGISRPWRWLAAVAQEARRQGHHQLGAHLGLFTFFWVAVLSPPMNATDEMELRLPKQIAPGALAGILSAVLPLLAAMDQELYLVGNADNPDNAMQAKDVLYGCASLANQVSSLLDAESKEIVSVITG
jgi:hypothetical protein